ncbi:hypothetical protein AB0J35_43245 [Nonomuraea angiospora]|uniref:hypothetical protein n=1 Tax=Nonomuraea angiospora TaxID=46172 RepID=UPI003415AA3B
MVVSDWWAARTTVPAALARQDIVMPGPDGPWGEALVAAVRDGRVPESAVDEKVLRLAARVGALIRLHPRSSPADHSSLAHRSSPNQRRPAKRCRSRIRAVNSPDGQVDGGWWPVRSTTVIGPSLVRPG